MMKTEMIFPTIMTSCQCLSSVLTFLILLNVFLQTTSQVHFGRDPNNRVILKPAARRDPSYLVIASKFVRPGKIYSMFVTTFQSHRLGASNADINVQASIQRNGISIAFDRQLCKVNEPETLKMKIPSTIAAGIYKLRVEGSTNEAVGGLAFSNETVLHFSQRSMTIFIQTDRPFYQQGQIVRFRTIPINTDLKAFRNALDIYMLDPNRKIMKRWMSRQTNLGAVSLTYPLSQQPVNGSWTIKVVAQGQVEEKQFLVEEYYQTRYEVKVWMPPIFMDTDPHIHGTVTANYTSGLAVNGNLTLTATVHRLKKGYGSYPIIVQVKFVENFFGHKYFQFDISEFKRYISDIMDTEVTVKAVVGEYVYNNTVSGSCSSIVYNNSIKLSFLGATPQVIKPAMPFKAYVVVSFFDGASLPQWRFSDHSLKLSSVVKFRSGGRRDLDIRYLEMSSEIPGLWEVNIDLKRELHNKDLLKDVDHLTLVASYEDSQDGSAEARLAAYAPSNHKNHLIQVMTSSKKPKVGEYIIFHVRTNYFVKSFNYLLVSKGIILLTGTEAMSSKVKTFAVALSAEMAPTSTLLVYHISRSAALTVDSITFPVDGISRNKFNVTLNNKKDKSGNTVEVIVTGEPGAYVALSGVDQELYAMQAGNELTHAEVMRRMGEFDEEVNSTLSHIWSSREGGPDHGVYFPSSTYGIDANRTFDFAGLIVFTDTNLTSIKHECDASMGYLPCLSNRCYLASKQCDGQNDCDDASDESNCPSIKLLNITNFRINRYNRLQRLYDNSWLWKDVNIGPHGYYIFREKVPVRPAKWVISGFGMSQKRGFGLLHNSIQYNGVRPFFMIVEMPSVIMQGEQLGIRATVFNYLSYEIEALIVLADSPDYKFVHVEGLGSVQSYRPRTSQGEHQHLVWIKPGAAKDVYIPIVSAHLGEFNVTIMAKSLVGKDVVTRSVRVEADGIPQHTHTSLTIDLSQGAYQLQYLDMNLQESPDVFLRNERRYVYGSNRAKISFVGDVIGPAFPVMPLNAMNMIRKPFGSGENSMFNFAANLHTLLYMRHAGLWKASIQVEAFNYLNIDYQRIMSYQNDDGSFSPFRWNTNGSVWLTAFCASNLYKATFNEWQNLVYIDQSIISSAMNFIVDYQTDYGAFYETTLHAYDRKMNLSSDLRTDYGKYRNISLTAHVLITLVEVKNLQGTVGTKVASARAQAITYLESMVNVIERFDDPYELAIVSYALTLAQSTKGREAFDVLNKMKRTVGGMHYWGSEEVVAQQKTIQNSKPYLMPRYPAKYDASNVETTAYALLTYVHRQGLIQTEIVQWLNNQRLHDSGWASTQDTIIAMQALMYYSVRSQLRDVTDITITVEVPSYKEYVKQINIREDNLLDLQVIDIPSAWGTILVKAEGAGMALLQLSVQYNVDWPQYQIQPPVPAFSLKVYGHFWGKNSSHINFRSCQRWTYIAESPRSGMAVVEATIPTGYVVQQQDLDRLVLSQDVRNLKRAHYYERKVIFYFDFLDRYEICVNFTLQRWYPVANMSRFLPFKVYDYYAPERFNETSIDVYNLYTLNICQVCGSYQCPYCPIFSPSSVVRASIVLLISSYTLFVIFSRSFVVHR
ncbi:Tep6 (predicted) [Pycnogonum litorale]